MLIRKIAKAPKRSSRYRSQAHCNHIRSHACVMCDAAAPIEVAHIRIGSGAGMGQKPHDYWAVPLCRDCHARQHREGERSFWEGKTLPLIIDALIATSPKRREIEAHRNG